MAKYGLRLHPTKTRYVDFRPGNGDGHNTQGKFDFLGFTHLWGKSRHGRWVVRQFTIRKRLARAIKSVEDWCKHHRHLQLENQQQYLARVIQGHCNFFGLTGNGKQLVRFRNAVIKAWRRWLGRRHRAGRINWDGFKDLLMRFPLPQSKVVRSIYTSGAKLSSEEPDALIWARPALWGKGISNNPFYPAYQCDIILNQNLVNKVVSKHLFDNTLNRIGGNLRSNQSVY